MPLEFEPGAFLDGYTNMVVNALASRHIICEAERETTILTLINVFASIYTKIPDAVRRGGGLVTTEFAGRDLTTSWGHGDPVPIQLSYLEKAQLTSEKSKALIRKLELIPGQNFGVIITVDDSVRLETTVPTDPVVAFGAIAWGKIMVYFMGSAKRCNMCGSIEALKACSGCNLAKYCSVVCQHNAWPAHKQRCKAAIVDLHGVDAALVASRFSKVARLADNYVRVRLGHATADVCVSRAPAYIEGQWREYLGISIVQVDQGHRRKGEMMRLVKNLVKVATQMKRCLCITEVRAAMLQDILQKHHETWVPYAWVAGDKSRPAESFVHRATFT